MYQPAGKPNQEFPGHPVLLTIWHDLMRNAG